MVAKIRSDNSTNMHHTRSTSFQNLVYTQTFPVSHSTVSIKVTTKFKQRCMREYATEKLEASTHLYYGGSAGTVASLRALRNPRVSAVMQQMNEKTNVCISGIANFVRSTYNLSVEESLPRRVE
jgi:hypothetical protein